MIKFCKNCYQEHKEPSNFCSQKCADEFIDKQMINSLDKAFKMIGLK